MCRLRESTIVFCIHVYIIKEQQTEVINIKCYLVTFLKLIYENSVARPHHNYVIVP